MSQTPPFRNRPNLHLSLTPLSGSPIPSRLNTPLATPFGTTKYSPFRSAGLIPPTPYGGPVQFSPRRSKADYVTYTKQRLRRTFSNRLTWLLLFFVGLVWWWGTGGKRELELVKLKSVGVGKGMLAPEITRGLQFFPASNPKIYYVGRWTAAPNRLRKDGAFPGVYFDVTVSNTSTLLLSLHNSPLTGSSSAVVTMGATENSTDNDPGHVSFHSLPDKHIPASPISLLARVDEDEYILLPNSTGLVSVRTKDLDPEMTHDVRIVAPMTDDKGRGIIEFEGIWIDKGGKILRVEGSQLSADVEDEDVLDVESSKIGEKHRLGLSRLLGGGRHDKVSAENFSNDEDKDMDRVTGERRKMLEIITDTPGSFGNRHPGRRKGGVDGILAGVMGWEYLLGEMFSVDHVGIGVDGMCLTQGCVGGTGQPAGMGDVFFRSGPDGSDYYAHPWMFQTYVPDVMVINVGASDHYSFDKYLSEYNEPAWNLSERFEDTYVSLIKAIRELAYPKHPAAMSGDNAYAPSTAPASIPIFVMRPLRGQLEHATQGVVNRLRADGDKSVFWLDTSGWLETDATISEDQDFFLDESASTPRWRLTERGNQRVAIFLHTHVCRYLAAAGEKCAFLPPEVYQGKVFQPESANLDRYVEDEKERKLKKLFWNE
ncbi:MAG: hypothetical protein M1812_005157 [Candelaria pacifica]|nr:MAG: hypothetical protein M1812_005157 [Candelaria pacifica]